MLSRSEVEFELFSFLTFQPRKAIVAGPQITESRT